MRKRTALFCAAIPALILIDQGSKLLVNSLSGVPITLFHSHSSSGWFTLSITPELHTRFNLPVNIVIFILAAAFTALIFIYLKHERSAIFGGIDGAKNINLCPGITFAAAVLWTSGMACSTLFDAFFWNGSLDFICFDRAKFGGGSGGEIAYTDMNHLNFDLKDLYLFAGMILILIRCLARGISLSRLSKADRALISKRSFHFIKSIREEKSETSEAEKTSITSSESRETNKEEIPGMILDIFVAVALGIISSLLLGMAIYVIAVWVIIPIATEIFSPLDAFLTAIGNKYDAEKIYGAIKSFSNLLGIFPGIYFANYTLKNREKYFIRSTGGMITLCDGIAFHLEKYLLCDVVSVLITVLICFLLWISGRPQLSPLAFIFDFAGIPLGLAASVIFTALAQLLGVVFAQGEWRADYFYGE